MLQRHGTAAQADQAGPDSFTRDEPLLQAVRMAQAAQLSQITTPGAILTFSPVVPVENRAGRLTGRALACSVEPGTVIFEDTEVTLSGLFTLPDTATVCVSGSFHVGFSDNLPEAQYSVSGPAEAVALVREHLPRSSKVEALPVEELNHAVATLANDAEIARATLCELFVPMMQHKAALVGGYRSATWSDADSMQELLAAFSQGVTRFASADRPNTSLFSWADIELWRALERALCRDSGLSGAAWKARRWLLDNGIEASSLNAKEVATSASVSEAAAEAAILNLRGHVSGSEIVDTTVSGSVSEDWSALAAKAGLTHRQRRVCEARLMADGELSKAPWKDVAKRIGYSERTCQRLYKEARQLLSEI